MSIYSGLFKKVLLIRYLIFHGQLTNNKGQQFDFQFQINVHLGLVKSNIFLLEIPLFIAICCCKSVLTCEICTKNNMYELQVNSKGIIYH